MEHALGSRCWWLRQLWSRFVIGAVAFVWIGRALAVPSLLSTPSATAEDESIVVYRVKIENTITVRYRDHNGQAREYTTRHEKERVFSPPLVIYDTQSLIDEIFGLHAVTWQPCDVFPLLCGEFWAEWERWRSPIISSSWIGARDLPTVFATNNSVGENDETVVPSLPAND